MKTIDINVHGTTSACAENTLRCQFSPTEQWNYLRVRGEYNCKYGKVHYCMELPPRARRILRNLKRRLHLIGTTSACAENTIMIPTYELAPRNYLRVRGEYINK